MLGGALSDASVSKHGQQATDPISHISPRYWGGALSNPLADIQIFRSPKSLLYPPPSRPIRGAFAIVTDAGRDAVDAGATDERA